jgi:hypothetical protein
MTQSIKMLPAPCYIIKRTPANIVKAYENDLESDRSLAKPLHVESSRSSEKAKYREPKQKPFAAEVRRRWTDTTSKIRRRLGQYAFMEPLPIGMYLDIAI